MLGWCCDMDPWLNEPFYVSPVARWAGGSLLPASVEAMPMFELHMCSGVYCTGLPSSAPTRASARCTAVSDGPPHCQIKLPAEEEVQVTGLGPDRLIGSCSELREKWLKVQKVRGHTKVWFWSFEQPKDFSEESCLIWGCDFMWLCFCEWNKGNADKPPSG